MAVGKREVGGRVRQQRFKESLERHGDRENMKRRGRGRERGTGAERTRRSRPRLRSPQKCTSVANLSDYRLTRQRSPPDFVRICQALRHCVLNAFRSRCDRARPCTNVVLSAQLDRTDDTEPGNVPTMQVSCAARCRDRPRYHIWVRPVAVART